MNKLKYYFYFLLCSIVIIFPIKAYSDNHNLKEVIELIQKDLRTLERAVYSESFSKSSEDLSNKSSLNQDTEEALTRHLLKLSEIEKQFQDLTNKYEEINFKLDKLSNRLSKVQADNQIRFQQLENGKIISNNEDNKLYPCPICPKPNIIFCSVKYFVKGK